MNLYAYVGNDPTNENDPSGHASCSVNGGDSVDCDSVKLSDLKEGDKVTVQLTSQVSLNVTGLANAISVVASFAPVVGGLSDFRESQQRADQGDYAGAASSAGFGILGTVAGKGGTATAKAGAMGLEKLVEKLLDAGAAIDKGDLTKAGRGLAKHGSRPGSVFPAVTGSNAAKNAQGQAVLQQILGSKNVVTRPNRFGGQDIFDKASGRGVRYDGNGNMMGFLEP